MADILTIARQFLYVREAQSLGQNQGQRVNAIQTWALGKDGLGTSWCCEFATMVLDIAYQGAAPIPRGGACQDVYALAKGKGWLTDVPQVGDLVLSVDANDHAHHIGFCTVVDPLTVLAGNTSADGQSSNGDGVYEHAVSPAGKKFVRYP